MVPGGFFCGDGGMHFENFTDLAGVSGQAAGETST
jgi:hypothetical protein